MKINIIRFQTPSGMTYDAHLEYDRLEINSCFVSITHEYLGGTIKKTSTDFFSSLMEIRREFDAQGIKLLCWGARTDVWPNPTQQDWVSGLLANCHIIPQDLIDGVRIQSKITGNIFAPALPEVIGTVTEFEMYVTRFRQYRFPKQSSEGVD